MTTYRLGSTWRKGLNPEIFAADLWGSLLVTLGICSADPWFRTLLLTLGMLAADPCDRSC